MKNTVWMVISLLLSLSSVSTSLSAADKLAIHNDSSMSFSGVFEADDNVVLFDTTTSAKQVSLNIEINGSARQATYDIESTLLEFTSGQSAISEIEKELMYDAVKTLVDYANNQPSLELNDNFVVLVGVMNDWSVRERIQ